MIFFSRLPDKRIILLVGIFFVFAFYNTVLAIEDDFGQAKKIEGKYFVTYYSPQSDIQDFLQQLNISPIDKFLGAGAINKAASPELEFAANVDALFIRICDILDMHLYSFSSTIKICRDYAHLKRVYNRVFDKELRAPSFYVHDLNTIYISAENLKSEILGHEMAHSLISRYFVVMPPEKIQEILAGYAEYQLRKSNSHH